MVSGYRLAVIQMESGMVVHVDCRHAQHLKSAFDTRYLTRPEIADAGRLLPRFGDETGIKGDDIMAAAVPANQSAVEAHEIKWLLELDTVALFTIFAVPFQLLEIDPALYRKEQGHGLDHETLPAYVDIFHIDQYADYQCSVYIITLGDHISNNASKTLLRY